jgi:predicted kinase
MNNHFNIDTSEHSKTLFMMMGLPHSGKSTLVKKAKKENDVIVSADRVREIMHGGFIQEKENKIWEYRETFLIDMLDQGFNIFIDETNIHQYLRNTIIHNAKKYNYSIIGVVVQTPKEICYERFKKEGEKKYNQMKSVIDKMEENWQPPKIEEGFDKIIKIKGYNN